MNNLDTRIILINQYFLFFLNFSTNVPAKMVKLQRLVKIKRTPVLYLAETVKCWDITTLTYINTKR